MQMFFKIPCIDEDEKFKDSMQIRMNNLQRPRTFQNYSRQRS